MKRVIAVLLLAVVAVAVGLCRIAGPATSRSPVASAKSGPEPPVKTTQAAPRQTKTPAQSAAELSRALREGTPDARDRALRQSLPELVAADPREAVRLASEWEPGTLHDELVREVVRAWLARDVSGALAWISSLGGQPDKGVAGTAAIDCLSQNDPASAIELALALGIGTGDGRIEHLAQLWAEENPAEAEAWIEGKAAGPDRDRLLARMALVHAQRNPAEAANLVLTQIRAGDVRDEALLGVVRRWAATDPAGATRWVAQLPPGPFADRAVGELATFSK